MMRRSSPTFGPCLLPVGDAATAALLRAYEGRRVTVTGYVVPGPSIYMRGLPLQVLEVAPAGINNIRRLHRSLRQGFY